MDILTIGEVLIDLTQTGKDERGIPQFAANPGGAPANLAVAAQRGTASGSALTRPQSVRISWELSAKCLKTQSGQRLPVQR